MTDYQRLTPRWRVAIYVGDRHYPIHTISYSTIEEAEASAARIRDSTKRQGWTHRIDVEEVPQHGLHP